MRVARLLGIERDAQCEACAAALDPDAPADYRELAALLVRDWSIKRPRRVGLAGGQGAGKTTLARLIEAAGSHFGLRILRLSIDDFYLSKAARHDLAREIHPLFETRGPPGTHDIEACRRVMAEALTDCTFEVPRFDKGRDDRTTSETMRGPFDLVVLEGWCVGARAVRETALLESVNALERDEDPDGVWRRAVNAALARDYEPLWNELDQLVFLQVPNLDSVRVWRAQQEQERRVGERMSPAEIERFIAHYERMTQAMRGDLPERADWVVALDVSHAIALGTRRH